MFFTSPHHRLWHPFAIRSGNAPPHPEARRHRVCTAAFTVTEVAVAGALLLLFITSLFCLNSGAIRLLRSGGESINASQDLQMRVEQVRIATWTQITDPNWIKANLLGRISDAAVNLPDLAETLTVSAYSSPASPPPTQSLPPGFSVTRDRLGVVTVSPAAYSGSAQLAQQQMIQVDVTVVWAGWGRTRTRSLTTLVSHWGVSK